MNALLDHLRRRAGPPDPDGALLGRYRADHDERAFVELVRRHGPLVYGACRRLLPDAADADDAFQAVWLVLVRRADKLAGRAALGPWLFQVAVWTARNLRRRNAHRLARTTAVVDVPDPSAGGADLRLDLDAALLALPEKYRTPVVLCHLQGWTRRDAAAHLGCPEGTLSALLARALVKLRKQLGTDPAPLLAAACVALPASLSASLSAAGASPAVVALSRGVLRMFWVKKVVAAAMVCAAVLGTGLGVGLLGGPDRATAQPPSMTKKPDDLLTRIKQLEDEILQLRKQAEAERRVEVLRAREAELLAKMREAERKESFFEVMARPLGSGLTIAVVEYAGPDSVRLVGVENPESLRVLLARAKRDPAAPRKVRITLEATCPAEKAKAIYLAVKASELDIAAYFGPKLPDEEKTLRLKANADDQMASKFAEVLNQARRVADRPAYKIAPPDVLTIEARVRPAAGQVRAVSPHGVTGDYIVRPDGTVGLGEYGPVRVTGATLPEAAELVRQTLAKTVPGDLVVTVDVKAFNSKRYFLEFSSGSKVEVVSFPLTGNETVVDAVGNVAGLDDKAKSGSVYLARDGKVLVVDWVGIAERGMTHTNYQLQAGDRLRVEPAKAGGR